MKKKIDVLNTTIYPMKNRFFSFISFHFDKLSASFDNLSASFDTLRRAQRSQLGTLLLSRTKATYVVLVLCLLSFVFLPSSLHSQTIPPPFINYQAVLYDVNNPAPNAVFSNQSFQTFVNISDELGNLLYREEHFASTDGNGLITVKMGDGLYVAGPIPNFNQIDWGTGKYYLVVDFNINGTTSSTAPEQLVTVPYSFYAGKAGNGMSSVTDNGNGTLTFTYVNGSTYTTPALSGIQGPVGATGPVGPAGPTGTPGAQGPAGSYTAGNGITISNNQISVDSSILPSNGQGIRKGFSTTGSWTCPPGVTQITVEIWGGAGGGGGGAAGRANGPYPYGCNGGCRTGGSGGNGGKGGYTKVNVAVTSGTVYSVSIGIGGAGGTGSGGSIYSPSSMSGSNGSNGGISNFNNQFFAPGGTGGSGGNSQNIGLNTGSCSPGTNGQDGTVQNYSANAVYVNSVSQPRTFIPIGYVQEEITSSCCSQGGSGGAGGDGCANSGNGSNGGNGSPGESGYCVISY
jgi:hypothetical protein